MQVVGDECCCTIANGGCFTIWERNGCTIRDRVAYSVFETEMGA